MDPMEQPEPEIAGHNYALQVGSYFLTCYYNVLTNQPHLASQFYTDSSSVVRLDCETGRWSFGETMELINDMMMSMSVSKVEVKTANFLESWGGAITLLVTGLVQLKDYPVRKRFAQNIVLAPKKDGYFIFSDIFKLICDEYDDQYPVDDYNYAHNMPQVDVSYTMAETGSDYLNGEPEVQETVAPVENHVQHQDPLEYKAGNVIYDETHPEEHIPSFPSSTDVKRDSPLAPPHPPSSPTLEEPVEEVPKTYASVLRKNAKTMMATAETQQAQQLAPQAQSAPVHEKSNLDNHRAISAPEDEEEFLSVYVGNLSPSTSVFDLEKVFQDFGRIKPDGVAIRSRKEAGVFFGFVEFEDMSGIQNALSEEAAEKLISQGTKLVGDTTGSMLLDRRELGTRKNLDASMTVTTSFVPALLVNGRVPLPISTWCCSGHSFAESQNDVETSISALLALGGVFFEDSFCYHFVASQ